LHFCLRGLRGNGGHFGQGAAAAKVSATVRRWMKTLTLREEVAQLVFIEFHGGSPNTRSRDYLKFVRLIRDTNVGGLILTNATNGRGVQKAEPYALAAFLNRMQRLARVPLMVGADFERGASMRVSGTTAFPPPWHSERRAIPS
jgi:beta-N-acetylhexosaminidase